MIVSANNRKKVINDDCGSTPAAIPPVRKTGRGSHSTKVQGRRCTGVVKAIQTLNSSHGGAPKKRKANENQGRAKRLKGRSILIRMDKYKQEHDCTCWTAVCRMISKKKKGEATKDETEYVTKYGYKEAQEKHKNNEQHDIHDLIGSGSKNNNLLSGVETSNFTRNVIGGELDKGNPLIANLNNEHYVIIRGRSWGEQGQYRLNILDPACNDGDRDTDKDTRKVNCITGIGGDRLHALYMTA